LIVRYFTRSRFGSWLAFFSLRSSAKRRRQGGQEGGQVLQSSPTLCPFCYAFLDVNVLCRVVVYFLSHHGTNHLSDA
jgi:hypothetical protein